MSPELQEIIKNSSFEIQEGRYVYVKVSQIPTNPEDHFMITCDKDEITVVTREELKLELKLIEKNKDFYTLIALNVSIPFYGVGFLAAVSSVIADLGLNILIVSTYSKDYVMVRADKVEEAKSVLISLGFKTI